MRRFATKPNQSSIPLLASEPETELEPLDVDHLLERGGEILRREIANLMAESSSRKLSPTSARDLVAYVKLLSELRVEQKKELANMSTEELERLTNEKT